MIYKRENKKHKIILKFDSNHIVIKYFKYLTSFELSSHSKAGIRHGMVNKIKPFKL